MNVYQIIQGSQSDSYNVPGHIVVQVINDVQNTTHDAFLHYKRKHQSCQERWIIKIISNQPVINNLLSK